MKCPKCGNELGEGNMYCEVCGEEIHIVPDFEPEIENSISDVLSNVAKEFGDTKDLSAEAESSDKDDFPTEDMRISEGFSEKRERSSGDTVVVSRKGLVWLLGILVGVIVIMVVAFSIILSRDNSVSYQMDMGDAEYAKKNYSKALIYYEQAYNLDNTDYSAIYSMANCYMEQGNYGRAIDAYEMIISKDSSQNEAWSQLILLLSSEKEFTQINRMIAAYASDEQKEMYKEYVSQIPEFSLEEGTYDKVIELELTSNAEGDIYYTLDGSEPGSDCFLYNAPITMRNGKFTVSAVFVNKYGICSDVVTKNFTVVTDAPDMPVVLLEDGKYNVPQIIEVIAPASSNVYYTSDGSEPGPESAIYTNPIAIPLGDTCYRFVAISKNGNKSEEVVRNYSLNVDAKVSLEDAINIVKNRQFELGRVIDTEGTVEGASGKYMYMYTEMRYVQNRTMYFISEYYQEGTIRMVTGNVFAVDVYDGSIYQAVLGSNDDYSLHSF